MLAIYALTTLVSASLLFIVQPMFARMVLPSLGGSPAVWNTALVFFQIALLAGYGYVHWTTTRLSVRTQVALHCGLLLAVGICLPLRIPEWWTPPTERNPIPSLLGLMTIAIGLPFFVVSTTGPLLQKWFTASSHRLAKDPYFLYSASNLGSIAGLLSYPLLIEPHLRLGNQSLSWSLGYALLVALTVICASLMRKGLAESSRAASVPVPVAGDSPDLGRTVEQASPHPEGAGRPVDHLRRMRWVLLAFAPSSLMMGVTTHITTDIAAVPLLWVLPLALYLLSFVFVFARKQLIPLSLAARIWPFLVLPLLVVMVGRPAHPILLIIALHLALLFIAALVCHGALAQDRPSSEHLTEFYLWLAVGGALGGLFNAVVAPLAFDSILEYPLAIALVCILAPPRREQVQSRRAKVLDFVLPALVALLVLGSTLALTSSAGRAARPLFVLLVAGLTLPIFSFASRPLRFGLCVAAVLLVNPLEIDQRLNGLHSERSFFGLHRVLSDPKGFHLLYNGSTLHGLQRTQPLACDGPIGYYSEGGPLGDIFRAVDGEGRTRSVAVAGLGAGGIAAYANAGQRWTYFEIDPVVERIAQDPKLFCYLDQAPADIRVVLGDARLSIARSPERFDLIILDAYSSDAIPVHLLTREAMELYLQHLSSRGMLVFHISNQYFRLAPVVATLAREVGLTCRVRYSGPISESATADGVLSSIYAVVARRPEDLGALARDPRWEAVPLPGDTPIWTDDFSSLFAALDR